MGIILFNGISSQSLHVVVEHPPAYDSPERDYEVTSIPGRNGDLILDNGAFNNVSREYEIAFDARQDGFSRSSSAVMSWLRSASGYARLEDSYDADYYRMACYRESTSVENVLNQAGKAKISFDCMPQRFLKSGETASIYTSSGTISNPTRFNAKPLISVVIDLGTDGELVIGNYHLNISGLDQGTGTNITIVLDCDLQDAVMNGDNWNKYISGKYPELLPGENQISFTGIQSVSITPRWWTV